MARPQCPRCSCILKWDVFKRANSYTDYPLTEPVGLVEILAYGQGLVFFMWRCYRQMSDNYQVDVREEAGK